MLQHTKQSCDMFQQRTRDPLDRRGVLKQREVYGYVRFRAKSLSRFLQSSRRNPEGRTREKKELRLRSAAGICL